MINKTPISPKMKKTTSKKRTSTAKTTAAKKAPVKKAPAKTTTAKKARVKKAPAKTTAAKKAPVKKAPAKTTVAKPKGTASSIAKQAKAAEEAKRNAKSQPESPTKGFSMDDVRQILQSKDSSAAIDPTAPKAKVRKTSASKKAGSRKRKFSAASVSDILGFNPGQKKTPQEARESKVPKKFLTFYRILIKLRNELRDDLDAHAQGTLLTSSQEESGDLSTNSTDAGSESFNRDVALSMVASEQEALQEVEAAIDRIFDGTFGICQNTGKPIKRDRLKAVPFTRFSLEGQALHEQSAGRQVERGGIFTNLSESVPGMQTDGDS